MRVLSVFHQLLKQRTKQQMSVPSCSLLRSSRGLLGGIPSFCEVFTTLKKERGLRLGHKKHVFAEMLTVERCPQRSSRRVEREHPRPVPHHFRSLAAPARAQAYGQLPSQRICNVCLPRSWSSPCLHRGEFPKVWGLPRNSAPESSCEGESW